jgi:hypothetical protein
VLACINCGKAMCFPCADKYLLEAFDELLTTCGQHHDDDPERKERPRVPFLFVPLPHCSTRLKHADSDGLCVCVCAFHFRCNL